MPELEHFQTAPRPPDLAVGIVHMEFKRELPGSAAVQQRGDYIKLRAFNVHLEQIELRVTELHSRRGAWGARATCEGA